MRFELVGWLSLSAALLLTVTGAATAQSASAPEPGARASNTTKLPILSTDPTAGHLRPGEQVLVDDGSCPSGQIKEVTGGSNRKCPTNADALDTTQCHPAIGSRRTLRCIVRP